MSKSVLYALYIGQNHKQNTIAVHNRGRSPSESLLGHVWNAFQNVKVLQNTSCGSCAGMESNAEGALALTFPSADSRPFCEIPEIESVSLIHTDWDHFSIDLPYDLIDSQ